MKSVVTVTLNPAIDKTVFIPKLVVGGLNRIEEGCRLDPGGKGINVAKVLRQFGVNVTATGFIAGNQGEKLLKAVKSEGITVDFLQVQGETRTNLKIVDQSTHVTTEINDIGFHVTQADIDRLTEKFKGLLSNCDCVVLGGSYPTGVSPLIYQHYIELANDYGVKVILDAEGEALAEGIKAKPFAIKPNLFELETLTGRSLETEKDIVDTGFQLIKEGIKFVVISLGHEGAIFMNEHHAYRVLPFPIEPKSTVGAGDSMVGVIANGLLDELPLEQLAKWATTAGTITASKAGTKVCTLQEVKHALERVQLSTIV